MKEIMRNFEFYPKADIEKIEKLLHSTVSIYRNDIDLKNLLINMYELHKNFLHAYRVHFSPVVGFSKSLLSRTDICSDANKQISKIHDYAYAVNVIINKYNDAIEEIIDLIVTSENSKDENS